MENLTTQQVDAMLSVLDRTNCKRLEANNFDPAVCRFYIDGLPREKWCYTCIAKDALIAKEA